jgi:hypothetical protein
VATLGVLVPGRSPAVHEQHGVAERAEGGGEGVRGGDGQEGAMGVCAREGARPEAHVRRRLRAAGVGEETRKVLLGHKNGDITTHYSTAELRELIEAVQRIDASRETPAITLLRTPVSGVRVAQKSSSKKIGPVEAGPKDVMLKEILARPAGFEPTTPWFVGLPKALSERCYETRQRTWTVCTSTMPGMASTGPSRRRCSRFDLDWPAPKRKPALNAGFRFSLPDVLLSLGGLLPL